MAQFEQNGIIYEEMADGNVRVVGYSQGQGGGMPADPKFQYEGQTAGANLRGKEISNQVDAATAPFAGPKAAADAQSAQANAALAQLKLDEARAAASKKGGPSSAADALLNVIAQIDNIAADVQDNGGWGETGFTGARLRGWEGTAAYDIAQKLKTVDANLAFAELQKMRDNSPTGGALGQVTEKELDLLRSTVSNLDPNQSQGEFLAALKRARDSYTGMLGRVAPETATRLQQEYEKQGKDPLVGYVGSGGNYYGPSGPVDTPPPASGGTPGAADRDTFMGAVDAYGRNFANAGSLGLADRFSAGANAILPLDNMFGANNRSVWDGSSLNDAYAANLALQQRTNAADRQVNPMASLAGDASGSIAGMVGANRLLTGLGAGSLVARTGGIAGDIGYGTARGAVEDGPRGALIGGGASLAGGLTGRYVLGPAAGALAASRPGQAVINTVGRGVNALGNAGRGLLGRSPSAFTPVALPSAVAGGERAAMARIPDDVTDQLTAAQQMGLPMSLADTSPQLQQLAGSVARKSPDAYAIAQNAFGPRALGQADRAQAQIARNFGPVSNPNEISDNLLQQARTNAGPLYDAFRSQPARTSDELQALLGTPAGQQALNNARAIAANEGRDPNAMGFDLNDLNQVVLRSDPSPETLDLVKRGLDDVVSGAANPLTGRIETDAGRSVEGLRKRFVAEVDRLYPNYATARAAYAGPAAERAALQQGRDLATANPRDIQVTMGRMTPGQQDQFRLGQRVAMSDAVDRVRFSSNPYQSIYGSPVAQQRAATVFGEGPAANMLRAYDAEQTMGRTAYDTLGGSPTALRQAADEAFDGPLATTIDTGFTIATGGGAPSIGGKVANYLKDTARVRGSKKKADQIAPILFNTNPDETLAMIRTLNAKSAAREAYMKRARKSGGVFGASLGVAAAPSLR